MAKKPCRFCMRVRAFLTKYLRSDAKLEPQAKARNNAWDKVPYTFTIGNRSGGGRRRNMGYIQGDSLLTVIIIVALVVALVFLLR